MTRSNKGDKEVRGPEGELMNEELAFTCKKCGAKWKQSVNYGKSGKRVVKWRKVA